MKRVFTLLLCVVLCISMFACAGNNEEMLGNGKSRIPRSESSFKGKHYDEVILELEKAGFTNIDTEILYDVFFGIITKEGEVESVAIEGYDDFHKGDIIESNTPITVTYHLLSEDDPTDRTYSGVVYDHSYYWAGTDGLRAKAYVYYFFSETDHTVLRVSHSTAGKGSTYKSYGTFEGSFDGIVTIKLNNREEKIEFINQHSKDTEVWTCEEHSFRSTDVKSAIQTIKNWH